MSGDFRFRLLVVEDQPTVRRLCSTTGTSLGFVCTEAENAQGALACLESDPPDLVLADVKMEDMTGPEFLEQVKRRLPHTEVAILTGFDDFEGAVQAMRLGAYDYVTTPPRVEELKLVLQRMAEKIRLVQENHLLRERLDASAAALPETRTEPPPSDLEEMERATIQRVFEEVKGDKALAGRKLGISRATLYRKLKRYGIRGRA